MFVASYSEGLFSYLLSACLWFFPRLYPRLRSRTLQFPVSRQFLARSPIFVCIPLLLLSSPLFFANPESLAFVGYEIRWSYSPSFFLLFSLRFLFFSSFILFVLPASTAIKCLTKLSKRRHEFATVRWNTSFRLWWSSTRLSSTLTAKLPRVPRVWVPSPWCGVDGVFGRKLRGNPVVEEPFWLNDKKWCT